MEARPMWKNEPAIQNGGQISGLPQAPVKRNTVPPMLKLDGITLDLEHHRVIGRRGIRRLTPKEAELLAEFMRHPEEVLTRQFLMKHVWQTDYMGDTRTLNVHIRWLREKIEDDPSRPRMLRTIRGVGYRFGIPRS
ncbi:MAG: winged helix-turn-helix domain-containing protein [Chloroflexi bacterium]|nr:winged helix-turn-helix domain-containing protein [Chloroflexota bacterium]